MKYLIAPNAFKGTISASRAASIIRTAILDRMPSSKTEICPIADGGDGTCELLGEQLVLEVMEFQALNAVGRPVQGKFFLDRSNAVGYLDVSTVSGLQGLKPHEINAHLTSTYGTGELIRHSLGMGVSQIVLGLGGSATVDMGTGILRALGYVFLDKKGRELTVFSPGFLSRIAHIQSPAKQLDVEFTCLCDVQNKFFGEDGAIPVFGPQKGLAAGELRKYEMDAIRLFDLFKAKSKKHLEDLPGFGAAGGIALGLSAFFPVVMREGAKFFFEQVGMEKKMEKTDWVITGEGRYDSQSTGGKGSYELLQLARKQGKKTVLITSGNTGEHHGFDKIILLPDLDFNREGFRLEAEKNLYDAVAGSIEPLTELS